MFYNNVDNLIERNDDDKSKMMMMDDDDDDDEDDSRQAVVTLTLTIIINQMHPTQQLGTQCICCYCGCCCSRAGALHAGKSLPRIKE